jgi:hypothetical protein
MVALFYGVGVRLGVAVEVGGANFVGVRVALGGTGELASVGVGVKDGVDEAGGFVAVGIEAVALAVAVPIGLVGVTVRVRVAVRGS